MSILATATESDADATYDDAETYAEAGPRCRVCGGPVLYYAGSVHGWTCRGCLADYVNAGAAKAEARDRQDRQRLARKRIQNSTL